MPVASTGAGMGMQAVSSYMTGKMQADSAQQAMDFQNKLLSPTFGGRETLGQLVNESLQSTGAMPQLAPNSPGYQAASSLAQFASNPDFINQFILSQDPRNTYQGLQQDAMAGFGGDMQDILRSTGASFGGKYGLRGGGSSELDEQALRLGSDQALRLRSGIASLFPQLQGNFNQALGFIPGMVQTGGQLANQRDISSMQTGSQFLNNFFPPQQYDPGGGGIGGFMGSAGESAMMWPLLMNMISGNKGGAPPEKPA